MNKKENVRRITVQKKMDKRMKKKNEKEEQMDKKEDREVYKYKKWIIG